MKKMSVIMKGGVGVLFVLLAAGALLVYRKNKADSKELSSETNRYYVTCDEDAFILGITNHMYASGYDVPLVFPVRTTDKDYTFSVDGVEEFTANYYPGTGYLVMFTMPRHKVAVDYQEHDLKGEELKEPVGEISFVKEENYSTGLLWEYKLSREDIVEIMEDKHVSDPFDPDNPTAGSGGLRFLKFKTIGSGTVEIRLIQTFQGAEEEEFVYRYQCDGVNAVLIE
ncbi:MAG: protease inhibitor I42 family protein [Lachnospiraceae bacterium]|nr:protease inhibitor I42 family protein [Lachnospiraceae bacterium]